MGMTPERKKFYTEAFRRALRKSMDSSLLRYEDDLVEAFGRDLDAHSDVWEFLFSLPDDKVEETLSYFMHFFAREIYPKTALAKLEQRIEQVEESVKETVEQAKEEIKEHTHEDHKELASALGEAVWKAAGDVEAYVIHEAEKTRQAIQDSKLSDTRNSWSKEAFEIARTIDSI